MSSPTHDPTTAPWVVIKYGGTSVSSLRTWETILSRVTHLLHTNRVWIVVSAVSKVTNALLACLDDVTRAGTTPETRWKSFDWVSATHAALAGDMGLTPEEYAPVSRLLEDLRRLLEGIYLTGEVSPRLRARVASMGELLSSQLGLAFLRKGLAGTHITRVDARTLLTSHVPEGVTVADSDRYLEADVRPGPQVERGEGAAGGAGVVITQGFIAATPEGSTCLLGRGGSDTSGALFAAFIGAVRLEIWTDVNGMFTADPRYVKGARIIRHLTYREAQELAAMGARVLHPRCLLPAASVGVPVQIRNTMDPGDDAEITTVSVSGRVGGVKGGGAAGGEAAAGTAAAAAAGGTGTAAASSSSLPALSLDNNSASAAGASGTSAAAPAAASTAASPPASSSTPYLRVFEHIREGSSGGGGGGGGGASAWEDTRSLSPLSRGSQSGGGGGMLGGGKGVGGDDSSSSGCPTPPQLAASPRLQALSSPFSPEAHATSLSLGSPSSSSSSSSLPSPPSYPSKVLAVARRKGVTLLSMSSYDMWGNAGYLGRIFSAFGGAGVSVDLVATSQYAVSVTLDHIPEPGVEGEAFRRLTTALSRMCTVSVRHPCAVVSVVGRGLRRALPVLGSSLKVMGGVECYMVSEAAEDLSCSFVVDEGVADGLVAGLHRELLEGEGGFLGDEQFGPPWEQMPCGGSSIPGEAKH